MASGLAVLAEDEDSGGRVGLVVPAGGAKPVASTGFSGLEGMAVLGGLADTAGGTGSVDTRGAGYESKPNSESVLLAGTVLTVDCSCTYTYLAKKGPST